VTWKEYISPLGNTRNVYDVLVQQHEHDELLVAQSNWAVAPELEQVQWKIVEVLIRRITPNSQRCRITTHTDRLEFVRLEVFTAVTMKNAVFWDVTLCGFCKNRRFGGT
jgi:hypothetical protein